MRLNLSIVMVSCVVLVLPGLNAQEEVKDAAVVGKRAETARLRAKVRQERAFAGGYPYQPTASGYGYKPPTTTRGYVYTRPTTTTTTTTTTPEPAIESELDIDSQYVTPAPPEPVYPEREFESSPVVVDDSPDEWDIRDSVPGSPGENYPVYGFIPKTGFRCETRIPGYYADPETRCQVFHRCSDCTDNVRLQMDSFLCPNGTQFNQEILSCDWWQNVHCDTANVNRFYSLNQELNTLGDDGEYLKFSGNRQAPSLREKIVAPRIIPKEERQPLAPQYRSGHRHSDGDGSQDSNRRQAPPLSPAQAQVVFNEFRRPTNPPKPFVPSGNQAINSALNNPDYFNPDPTIDPRRVEVTPASVDTLSDEDYFNNDAVETRSNIVESEDDKLDNDPLNPELKPTTTRATSSAPTTIATTSTTTEKSTVAPKEIEFGDRKLQPLIPFQRSLSTDLPEGFIVNRRPANFDEQNSDFNQDDAQQSIEQTTTKISGTTQPQDVYLPPKKDYLPPTTTAAPEYLPPSTQAPPEYLPPSTQAPPEYLPPSTQAPPEYLPPSTEASPEYIPPRDSYLPPNDEYLPPKNDYLPPQQELQQDSYAPVPDSYYRKPSAGYGAPSPSFAEPPSPDGGYSSGTTEYQSPQYSGYSVVQPAPFVFSNFMSTQFQSPPSEAVSSFEIVRSPLLSYNHVTSESQPTNYFTSPSVGYYQGPPPSYY